MNGMSETPRAARIVALADQCVQCGLCLPYCPTYGLDRTETESPRGRIALAKAVANGSLVAEADLRGHLDHCLGCLACERVCPSGVQYGALLAETRALLGPSSPRVQRLAARLAKPAFVRAAARLARLTLAWRWLPTLARLLPADSALRAALVAVPRPPSSHRLPATTAPRGTSRGRVALFTGCVASVYEAEAHAAAARLLAAAGFEVIALPAQCCGALARHGGDAAAADAHAAEVRAQWQAAGAARLVNATPGCLGTLREALPGVAVDDVPALLDREGEALRFRPLAERVAVHLPCTAVNVARSDGATLRLLARVPGLEALPLPATPGCCGAAGSHLLEFPQRAATLRTTKLEQAATLAPQRLLSGNIGCRLHLEAGLRERGMKLSVEHPLTLLARQLETP